MNAFLFLTASLCALTATFVAGNCADDCSLNGDCITGECVCLPAWRGATCGELTLLPAEPDAGLHAPSSGSNTSSWGGAVAYDELSGRWTMFAAEMAHGCGINGWQTNSQIVRAVADTPGGRYQVEEVIMPPFAHEPALARLANESWLMYQIGSGSTGVPGPPRLDCRAGYTPKASPPVTSLGGFDPPVQIFLGGQNLTGAPWTLASTIGNGDFNPSPLVASNGSVILMWRHLARVHLVRTPSWPGPYPFNGTDSLFDPVIDKRLVEDPFLYTQPTSQAGAPPTFHALFHDHTSFGGHAFSSDGVTWKYSQIPPYGGSVVFTDGTNINLTRRERPHLIFDRVTGHISHLSTGAQPAATDQKKPPTDAFNCDFSYTLIQPVQQGSDTV